MAGAIIVIDQPGGAGAGSPGVARNDLWQNKQINLSCATVNGTYQWDLLDVPPGSGATLTGGGTSTPHFLPDLIGTYRIQLITNGGGPGNVQILVIRVRFSVLGVLQNRGWSPPAFGEQSGESNYGGNTRGWAEEIEYILADIRATLTTLEASNTLVTWTSVRASLAAASSTIPFNAQDLTNFGNIDNVDPFSVLVNGTTIAVLDEAGIGGLADPAPGSQYAATAAYVDDAVAAAVATITAAVTAGFSSLGSQYVPMNRTLNATAPLRINGSGSADLSAHRTLSINAADANNAGTMSGAHYALLAGAVATATGNRLMTRDASADTAVHHLVVERIKSPGTGLAIDGDASLNTGVTIQGSYFGATSSGSSGMDLSVNYAGGAMHLIANSASINLTYGTGGNPDTIRMTGDEFNIQIAKLGFRGQAPVAMPDVTGSLSSDLVGVVQTLLNALQIQGIISNSTTA